MHRLLARDRRTIEPRGYVRGGFGDEMDFAYVSVTGYFLGLPGWQERHLDPREVIYLTGFFAFIALASRLTRRHPMFVHDAPLSVLRGFTGDELSSIASAAGAPHAIVRHRWPYRLLLTVPS